MVYHWIKEIQAFVSDETSDFIMMGKLPARGRLPDTPFSISTKSRVAFGKLVQIFFKIFEKFEMFSLNWRESIHVWLKKIFWFARTSWFVSSMTPRHRALSFLAKILFCVKIDLKNGENLLAKRNITDMTNDHWPYDFSLKQTYIVEEKFFNLCTDFRRRPSYFVIFCVFSVCRW